MRLHHSRSIRAWVDLRRHRQAAQYLFVARNARAEPLSQTRIGVARRNINRRDGPIECSISRQQQRGLGLLTRTFRKTNDMLAKVVEQPVGQRNRIRHRLRPERGRPLLKRVQRFAGHERLGQRDAGQRRSTGDDQRDQREQQPGEPLAKTHDGHSQTP